MILKKIFIKLFVGLISINLSLIFIHYTLKLYHWLKANRIEEIRIKLSIEDINFLLMIIFYIIALWFFFKYLRKSTVLLSMLSNLHLSGKIGVGFGISGGIAGGIVGLKTVKRTFIILPEKIPVQIAPEIKSQMSEDQLNQAQKQLERERARSIIKDPLADFSKQILSHPFQTIYRCEDSDCLKKNCKQNYLCAQKLENNELSAEAGALFTHLNNADGLKEVQKKANDSYISIPIGDTTQGIVLPGNKIDVSNLTRHPAQKMQDKMDNDPEFTEQLESAILDNLDNNNNKNNDVKKK